MVNDSYVNQRTTQLEHIVPSTCIDFKIASCRFFPSTILVRPSITNYAHDLERIRRVIRAHREKSSRPRLQKKSVHDHHEEMVNDSIRRLSNIGSCSTHILQDQTIITISFVTSREVKIGDW